jgi:A/G-specific adenine glycosylase
LPVFFDNSNILSIGTDIIAWFEQHGRDMPWRDTRDPYRIWIAEVILQQTRIETGVGYFYRFVERFPEVATLAAADQDEVLKHWEGLGYYSRARNLHAAAKTLVDVYGGVFPPDYQELMKLKGVGPYTARAIGSFAFDNPTGVIDGNVLRVMARVLGDSSPINQTKTRQKFQQLIDQWVEGVPSRPFNFGMMDLGSGLCTPHQPGCMLCPLQLRCQAWQQGMTALLPVKEKKAKRKVRYFHFYLVQDSEQRLAVRQRPAEGLWGGLWEIPNQEIDHATWQAKVDPYGGDYQLALKHVFTHFDMMIHVYQLPASLANDWPDLRFIDREEIPIFAFAKAVLKIFDLTWPIQR